ncbi:hypothetical protein RFI_01476, partial [Reticulomyxa filosa]
NQNGVNGIHKKLQFSLDILNQCCGIIERKKIGGMSLLKMSKKDWMDIFDFGFDQACTIHDSFTEICKKHPINVIDSVQQDTPKEFICPLSKSIMKDPVIASNGITYDRSSIMNLYKNIPDYPSLMTNGKLQVISDLSLKQKIQQFSNNSK